MSDEFSSLEKAARSEPSYVRTVNDHVSNLIFPYLLRAVLNASWITVSHEFCGRVEAVALSSLYYYNKPK